MNNNSKNGMIYMDFSLVWKHLPSIVILVQSVWLFDVAFYVLLSSTTILDRLMNEIAWKEKQKEAKYKRIETKRNLIEQTTRRISFRSWLFFCSVGWVSIEKLLNANMIHVDRFNG